MGQEVSPTLLKRIPWSGPAHRFRRGYANGGVSTAVVGWKSCWGTIGEHLLAVTRRLEGRRAAVGMQQGTSSNFGVAPAIPQAHAWPALVLTAATVGQAEPPRGAQADALWKTREGKNTRGGGGGGIGTGEIAKFGTTKVCQIMPQYLKVQRHFYGCQFERSWPAHLHCAQQQASRSI